MMYHLGIGRSPRPARAVCHAALLLLLSIGCSHGNQPETDEDPRPEPIPVHVKNENFLDMNVSVVAGGANRRLGTVSGNSAADFKIPWNAANGQGIYFLAVPIGGSGAARSATLNVSPGQVVDFRIASVLRQSVAIAHDP
jgi:hypothetical protein